jgi:hypothetical protein
MLCNSVFVCFFFCLVIPFSFQWGQEGHQIVANIASTLISNEALNGVTSFLGSNSMAEVAPFPDSYDHTAEGRWSSPCHYVNLPRNATVFEWSFCGTCCVIGAINNYTKILASEVNNPVSCSISDDSVEPCALIFLIHYIGDVHQPLHVGYGDDAGGNDVKVEFFGEKSELHAVWDTKIIEKWDKNVDSASSKLEAIIKDNPNLIAQYTATMDPVNWGDESFEIVRTVCYNFTTNSNGDGIIGTDYYDYTLPIIHDRLIGAGIRLAYTLNSLFKTNFNKVVHMHNKIYFK